MWYLGKEEFIAIEEKNGDEVVELFSQTVAASHTCRRSYLPLNRRREHLIAC